MIILYRKNEKEVFGDELMGERSGKNKKAYDSRVVSFGRGKQGAIMLIVYIMCDFKFLKIKMRTHAHMIRRRVYLTRSFVLVNMFCRIWDRQNWLGFIPL